MASEGFRPLDEKSLVEYIKATPCLSSKLGNELDDLQIKEVGDGNLNFVYIVSSPSGSFVAKQALPYIRCMGESWPMTKERAYFEAVTLKEHGRLCPDHVPEVYHFDRVMSLIGMRYLEPPHIILRKGLIAGVEYPLLAEHISEYMARTLFFTSLLHRTTTEEEEADAADGVDTLKVADGDEDMEPAEAEEDVKKRHAELLALPPHGSEVYLGGIPQDASEEDLRSFCESVGEVTEVRIMKGQDSSENKGYAFVTFRTKELASKAIEELNNSELKGKKIKCSTSQAKHKLFIGNVPRNWGEEDIKKVVAEKGPGVIAIELLKDPQNYSRNRGFAFIKYYNHACAEYSRQKMSKPEFKLDDNAPTVSWADPKNAESSAASQVKAVYVKNLPKNITQDQLRELFEHHGKITKVVLPPAKAGQEKSRFGFVHFAERSNAMKALKNTEKYELDGQVLECSLAKPQAEQKSSGGPNSQKSALLPSYPPRVGYGLVGGAYGALGAGYGGAGFGQPLIYGRGPTPSGMAMMPMLLPDGRIGYVLQQPGGQPHTPPPQQRSGRSDSRGGGSSGGRRGNDSGRGRSRYNPY